jgi:propionyl-CoA synthetase
MYSKFLFSPHKNNSKDLNYLFFKFSGTPDAGQFFRVIETHGVNGLFVAPTAIRAIKREDPTASQGRGYNLSSLRYLFVAGEHCDHGTRLWAQDHFRVPVLDNWWQTETGEFRVPVLDNCALVFIAPNSQSRQNRNVRNKNTCPER